jgi:hypothetical protein
MENSPNVWSFNIDVNPLQLRHAVEELQDLQHAISYLSKLKVLRDVL